MEHGYPDCIFQAANIDERDNEVSRGFLQITESDLMYFKPSKHPTRWPLDCIRRYGCTDHGEKFVFEAGRKCSTGHAIYAFRLTRGTELVEKLREKIDKLSITNNNIPKSPQAHPDQAPTPADSTKLKRKDASTSTSDNQVRVEQEAADPKPLSYALIDFHTTKALNESAQAHAASRVR